MIDMKLYQIFVLPKPKNLTRDLFPKHYLLWHYNGPMITLTSLLCVMGTLKSLLWVIHKPCVHDKEKGGLLNFHFTT